MDPDIERAIAERARKQLGLITRRQLVELGLSRQAISRRVAAGRFERAGSTTLRVAGAIPSSEASVLGACLDLSGVASHRTAAWLHGLLPVAPPRIDVTVSKGRATENAATGTRPWRVHTSTNLAPDDIVRVGVVPATSVARTLFGLAALAPHEVSSDRLLGLVEDAVRDRLASDRWLWWFLEEHRCRGRDGVIRFEEVLGRRAKLGPTESWLEREVLRILGDSGLPLPAVQRRIRRRGAFVARVDFLYPAERIVIEAMGYAAHRTRDQMSSDLRRAHALREEGLEVLSFTYDHIVHDAAWVVETVRRALASRAVA